MLTVLAAGDWRRDQVHVQWDGPGRRVVPEIERLIDAEWAKLLARPGVKLFDGPMVRLCNYTATSDRLDYELGETSYKPFVGTNMAHPELADTHGRDVMANPVGVSPLLLTADRKILMGRRRETLAYYPGRLHPFAGAMEPTDGHPFDALQRELVEELSLQPADVTDIRITGVVEDHRLRQTETIFRATTTKTAAAIIAAVDDDEHHDTWSIPATADAVADALAREKSLTPVGCAALLLWGRLQFGEDWFTTQYRALNTRAPKPDTRDPIS